MVEPESAGTSDDPQTLSYVYPREQDHPYSLVDPRNQFVQYNYRNEKNNKVAPHFRSSYTRNFNEKNSIIGTSPKKSKSRSPKKD